MAPKTDQSAGKGSKKTADATGGGGDSAVPPGADPPGNGGGAGRSAPPGGKKRPMTEADKRRVQLAREHRQGRHEGQPVADCTKCRKAGAAEPAASPSSSGSSTEKPQRGLLGRIWDAWVNLPEED